MRSISKKDKIENMNKVGIFASSLLVSATAVYIWSPIIGSNADDSFQMGVDATINPVASISLDAEDLSFSITPTSDGVFDSKSVAVTANTNSTGGYELYFSSIDDNTDMTHADSNISNVIASDFSGTVTSSTMAKDKWGYSLNDTDFSKIPALSNQAQLRNIDHYPSSSEKNTTVYIGTKISSDLPSGRYAKDVKFSLVVHDTPYIPNLHEVDYMQDMTPGVCAVTTTPKASATQFDWDGSHHRDRNYVPRKKLVDQRDGKEYIVSKLADGNCWMSQNLAIELSENNDIVISNNDGTTSFATPNNSTITSAGQSWSRAENNWRSFKPDDASAYYQNGYVKSSAPTAAGDEYAWESAGIYYNWYAATGGTGTVQLTSGEAPSSICPQGWRLPTSEGPKSLYNLFTSGYGFDDTTLLTEPAGTALRANPLNFILGGGYNWMSAKLDHATENGFYWMSTAYDGDNAYRMSSKLTYIKPQGNYHKGYGMPVRCVNI
jgi:uncharacterized protein (TIGR02145 family)